MDCVAGESVNNRDSFDYVLRHQKGHTIGEKFKLTNSLLKQRMSVETKSNLQMAFPHNSRPGSGSFCSDDDENDELRKLEKCRSDHSITYILCLLIKR
jgi:hypothetical protein